MPTKTSPKPLKIFFHAVDGVGHMNACVGIAQALAARGHQIHFLLNDAFAGQFAKFGFGEILLTQKPKTDANNNPAEAAEEELKKKNPVKAMAEVLINTGFLGPKSPLEKLKAQANAPPTFIENLYQQVREYNPQIRDAIEREKPDLFILDSFFWPPAVRQTGIPWLWLFSPNPVSLYKSDKLPPFSSGYSTASDPATWQEFKTIASGNFQNKFRAYQDKLDHEFGYEPSEEELAQNKTTHFIFSPYLNIYGFPEELDYHDLVPRPDNIAGVDAFLRAETESFTIPEELGVKAGEKLIYVSLGSMGSIDVELMKRILAVLAKTQHKYIVSKGQRGEEYDLPANCWGDKFLPQTRILPLVDLVITHGGNNTITETMAFGKPMIVMPLFGDQYDNAQRVDEKGYGVRIEPYHFTETQLIDTINRLLKDTEMQAKARAAADRMAKSNSKELVCERIERVAREAQKA